VISAVGEFNMGCLKAIQMREENRECELSPAVAKICRTRDIRRVKQSRYRADKNFDKLKKSAKRAKLVSENLKKQNEGPTYGAGKF
jgi:hypothetical protein